MIVEAAITRELHRLAERHNSAKESFFAATAALRNEVLSSIKLQRDLLLEEMFSTKLRVGDAEFKQLRELFRDYANRCDWCFIDLAALAACCSVSPAEIGCRVAPFAILHHAFRLLDDVLDNHVSYKGTISTLLADLDHCWKEQSISVAANIIPMLLIGISIGCEVSAGARQLAKLTCHGMLRESLRPCVHDLDEYRELANAKMVAYGSMLYLPIVTLQTESKRKPLDQFLKRSFYISQVINDLYDREEDDARKQPNYWALVDDNDAMAGLLCELEALSHDCSALDPDLRGYGHTRIADLVGYLKKAAVFEKCGAATES